MLTRSLTSSKLC